MGGDLSVTSGAGANLSLRPGSAYLHKHPPTSLVTHRATARFEVCLPTHDNVPTELPTVMECGGWSSWSALAGVINAVLNAREAPDTRNLALYAQSIETLAEALWFESVPPATAVQNSTFTRALELISTHASDPTFSIEVLARMLGVTRSRVTRLFRERGAMPSRILKRERVHRARKMLAIDPTASLEKVARSCGFSSPRLLRESLRVDLPREPVKDLRRAS